MNFGLLLSHLPRVQESRLHYNTMLSLDSTSRHRCASAWRMARMSKIRVSRLIDVSAYAVRSLLNFILRFIKG
jgi:hypothetical protein